MYIWEANPTIEDFREVKWQSIVASSDEKTYSAYRDLFRKHLGATQEDSREQQVFAFLSYICAITLRVDSPDSPFVGLPFNNGSIILETSQKDTLLAVLPEIQDAELHARIADLLWVLRHGNYQIAITAVNSYLKSANLLEDPEHWGKGEIRVSRALQIARQLGKTNSAFRQVIEYIETTLDKYQGQDPLFFSAHLMQHLLDVREGEPTKYAALAEKAATHFLNHSQNINWQRVRTHWEIASSWYQRIPDQENSCKALINAAETYVKEAESLPEAYPQRFATAAWHIQSAIEAYRNIPETEERRRELHKLLLLYQHKSVSDFGVVTSEVDISKLALQAINSVKEKGFHEALFSLALLASSPSKQALRELIQERIKDHGLMFWISAQIVDSQGKTTARRPGMSQDDSEKTIRAEMLREAVHQQGLIAEGIVRPAVNQINIDHYFEERDFLAIVVNNPFVPNSRAMLYARGLCAGLRGDMLVSTHLLIPQVENSIRYILQNNGFITSGLDDDQIQDEYSLQRILYTYGQALEKLLGEDLLFDLQGLLVERFGSNLRNLIAHGLINGQHFVNRQTVYLWWLALRLCCLPVYIRFQQQDDSEVNRAPDETAEASH